MTTTDQLAAIEARAEETSQRLINGVSNINDGLHAMGDRAILLAMVREQAKKLDAVEDLAKEYDGYAEHLTARADGYINGEYKSRHLALAEEERGRASAIRAALTATEGAE